MKRVWRCPRCKQISTRFGNLKRHIVRKHNEIDKPILQYVIGNSIITPEESPNTPQVFRDEYTASWHAKQFFLRANRTHIQNDDNWLEMWTDRYTQPVLKFKELRDRMNARIQSPNSFAPSHFSQFTQSFHAVSSNPTYNPVQRDSGLDIKPKNFDGVSGFKVALCAYCLTVLSMPIGPRDFTLEGIHTCDSMAVDAIMRLKPIVYAIDFYRKYQSLPGLLFQKCKDWANNTTGQLYLTVKSTRLLNDGESKNHEIQENYDSLPLISKVLSESKIKITDAELLEFLRLAKVQTSTTLTIRSNNSGTHFEHDLAVTNV